jgi:hypothetical protein
MTDENTGSAATPRLKKRMPHMWQQKENII